MTFLILSSKWFLYFSTLKNSFHKVKFLISNKVLHKTLNLAYAWLMLGMESHTPNLCRFKFSFLYGNVISYLERIRDGKFPHSWLSSHSEKKVSPFAASPLMGKFSFTIPANPFMGKLFFLYSWLRHSYRKNPIPNSFQIRNSSFLPSWIFNQLIFDITWQLTYIFLPRLFINGLLGNADVMGGH